MKNKSLKIPLIFACIYSLLEASTAHGNIGELFGYGGRSSALGNTMISSQDDAFSTYYNPAMNSSDQGANLSLGSLYMHPDFKKISNVVVSNSATSSDTTETRGDVDTSSYLDIFHQDFAFRYSFDESLRHLSLGFVTSLPITRLAYMDTGETFLPEYYNYRARSQRPQVFAGSSIMVLPSLYFGAGIAIGTSISVKTNYTVSASNGTVSYGQFSTTVKPNASPYASLFLEEESWNVGVTARTATKYKIDIDSTTNARVLGPANGFPIVFDSTSMVYYDPFEVDFGISKKLGSEATIFLEVDWYEYSKYETPSIDITDQGSAIQLKNSVGNEPIYRDIFVPKVGLEQHLSEASALRLGYAYRSSPIKDSSGVGNLVDPSQHIFSAGFGWDLKKAQLTERQITIDIFAKYHWLVQNRIVKSPGNEAGADTQSKVGSPEYDVGGAIYGGGASVTMLF